ncbi:hypothetical protein [Streptococcus sp. 20-1249]|uniref:hypothetical protein n=1 Tax=Streptococcus hepaticus TaxID=3349163 RepID=UPI002987FEA9
MPPIFAALMSANGLEALERFTHFKKLVGPVEVDILVADTTVSVQFSFVINQLELPKFTILNEQLLLLDLARQGSGQKITPLFVETPFDYEEESLAILACPVQKSDSNRLVFDIKDLEKVFLTQNNIM